MTEFDLARSDEILGLPTAGPKAVRGGTLRTTSYLVSTARLLSSRSSYCATSA